MLLLLRMAMMIAWRQCCNDDDSADDDVDNDVDDAVDAAAVGVD